MSFLTAGKSLRHHPFSRAAAVALVAAGLSAQCNAQATAGLSYQDLGSLGGTFVGPVAAAANGVIIGQAFTAQGGTSGFIYQDGAITGVGSLGGSASTAFCSPSIQPSTRPASGSTPTSSTPPYPSRRRRA